MILSLAPCRSSVVLLETADLETLWEERMALDWDSLLISDFPAPPGGQHCLYSIMEFLALTELEIAFPARYHQTHLGQVVLTDALFQPQLLNFFLCFVFISLFLLCVHASSWNVCIGQQCTCMCRPQVHTGMSFPITFHLIFLPYSGVHINWLG